MKKTAIIDSGVKCEHPAFVGVNIKCLLISANDSWRVSIDKIFYYEISYGIEVLSLINKSISDRDITDIKIYGRYRHVWQYRKNPGTIIVSAFDNTPVKCIRNVPDKKQIFKWWYFSDVYDRGLTESRFYLFTKPVLRSWNGKIKNSGPQGVCRKSKWKNWNGKGYLPTSLKEVLWTCCHSTGWFLL